MARKKNQTECPTLCKGIAAVAGLVAIVLFYWWADFGWLLALFAGGVFGVFVGLVLIIFMCPAQTAPVEASVDGTVTQTDAIIDARIADAKKPEHQAAVDTRATLATTEENDDAHAAQDNSAPMGNMADVTGTTAEKYTTAEKFTMQPSKRLAGQEELAARKGDWKYDGGAVKDVADAAPVAQDGKPALLDGPRAQGKDDLKLISGVGPKLEETLNNLGIYHFDQVAKWRKEEIIWVDSNLRFKGRIERDGWMSQAGILAQGGETEFSKKKKKS